MKIMSFNTQHCLNYIEDKIDFNIIADVIKKADVDFAGLNEMRGKGADEEYQEQTLILSELTEMKEYYFAKAIDVDGENPYGNGFLSKIPIISAENIPIPLPEVRQYEGYYEPRCILKVKLQGGITVLVTHFGLNPDEQKNAVDEVISNLEEEKCVLMGDFNMQPDNELLIPIRARMKDAADLFERNLLSFPSDKPDRKIDYIFVSPDIEVLSADIPPIVASDHRPHIALINPDVAQKS